jgi:hypothetical protein
MQYFAISYTLYVCILWVNRERILYIRLTYFTSNLSQCTDKSILKIFWRLVVKISIFLYLQPATIVSVYPPWVPCSTRQIAGQRYGDFEQQLLTCMIITSVGQNYMYAKRMDRIERKIAGRRIILERCTIEYIRGGISRASFKFCMGDKLREQMEGDKGMKHFSVHFNVHIPLLIVILKVPKCEIFDPIFFTSISPIWVGDLRTGEKKIFFRRPRQIFAILFFFTQAEPALKIYLCRLSLR